MKVLLVSTLDRGGPVEQALTLARGLVEHGVRVGVVCATQEVADRLHASGVAAVVSPIGPGADIRGVARLWRMIGGADVVHAQDRRSGLWTRALPGRTSVARVYTVHGLPDPYLPAPIGAERPRLRDRLAYELVDSGLSRRADALIMPSRALAQVFTERLHFPAERIVVVPNGVARIERPAMRGTAVGTLSLLEPVKDIPTFLRAVVILHPRHPGVRFTVAGDGSQRAALQRQARELGLSDVVDFPGFVPSAQMMGELGILVMPSVFENAPMAVLEAMAAGVPVVASRTGGIPELVGEDGAQLVTPGDAAGFAAAVTRLLDDPGLVETQVQRATARFADRYTLAANAAATLAVYERALADRRAITPR